MPGAPVREMPIDAVEKRFSRAEAVPEDPWLEFLTDNGAGHISPMTRRRWPTHLDSHRFEHRFVAPKAMEWQRT